MNFDGYFEIERFVRLAYNWQDYKRPSGPEGKSATGSYEAETGYAHEEWLNNEKNKFSKIEGYSQCFIQCPFTKPQKNEENLALWTKYQQKGQITKWWLIGFLLGARFVSNNAPLEIKEISEVDGDDLGFIPNADGKRVHIVSNVIYRSGGLLLLPRNEWIEIPDSLQPACNRYTWLKKKSYPELFGWLQNCFCELQKKRRIVSKDEFVKKHVFPYAFDPRYVETPEVNKITQILGLNKKQQERLVQARTNQTNFRKALLKEADEECMVTGLGYPQLLVASHIKPFAECEDEEESYDPMNGLLLSENIDSLFDKFLISFSASSGEILLADGVDDGLLKKFGIKKSYRLRHEYLTDKRKEYLKLHNARTRTS